MAKAYEYKGKRRYLREIAVLEGISPTRFVTYFHKFGDDPYGAVQHIKALDDERRKRQEKLENEHVLKYGDIPHCVLMAFFKIMGCHKYSPFNLRAGRCSGEYLFDGDLIAYQILMGKDEATVTARMKSNGNILTKRSVYV